ASGALDYTLKKDFPDTGAGGQSGKALAVVGAHVLVGAPGQSRVYVYDRLDPSTPPSPVQTIISPNASTGDNFGAALAPMGDTGRPAGAPGEDTGEGGVAAGAASLFALPPPPPTLLKRFVSPASPAPAAGAGFGSAVAAGGSFVIAASGDDAEA